MIDQAMAFISAQLHTNQFFSGATLAGIVFGALHTIRRAAIGGARLFARRFVVSLTVHSEDALYLPLSQWLKAHRFDVFAQRYRLRTDEGNPGEPQGPEGSRRSTASVGLGPDYGAYFFRHNRRWLRVSVAKEGEAGQQNTRRAQTREFLNIAYLGVSNALLTCIIDECIELDRAAKSQALPISMATQYGWQPAGRIPIRIEACPVVLAEGVLETVVEDTREFLSRADWYAQRGLPWRRGYLLHGPPGTGKTSLVRYLARLFGLPIYSIGSAGYMNPQLATLLHQVPPRSIILFEDIDTHDIKSRAARDSSADAQKQDTDSFMSASLGDLLNAIDGVNPPEEVLIVMTSNRPDAIDPALIRPGRIDRKIHLANATSEQAQRLASKFFPSATQPQVSGLGAAVVDGAWSPAELQEIFLAADSVAGAANAIAARERPHLELVRA